MLKIISTLLLVFIAFNPQQEEPDPKMKSILNGKNLKGWQVPACGACWTVANGILSVKNDPEKKGDILWTKKKYKNFLMELDFRFGEGTVDSGVFIRGEHDQLQIGISGSLKRDMTCSPYIPGKGYPVEASGVQDLLKMDDWNTIRLRVEGDHYSAWLNGKEVMNYTSETATDKGPLGIQLHPNREMSIDFRNMKIGKL